jgi:hypothetical protein
MEPSPEAHLDVSLLAEQGAVVVVEPQNGPDFHVHVLGAAPAIFASLRGRAVIH